MYQRCNRRIQLPEDKRPWRIQKEESLEPENSRFPPSSSIPLTRKPEDSGYKIAFSSLSTKCTHFIGKTKMDVSLIIFPKREFILSCLTQLPKRQIILLQSIDLCPKLIPEILVSKSVDSAIQHLNFRALVVGCLKIEIATEEQQRRTYLDNFYKKMMCSGQRLHSISPFTFIVVIYSTYGLSIKE